MGNIELINLSLFVLEMIMFIYHYSKKDIAGILFWGIYLLIFHG